MAENISSSANLTPQERRARLLHLLVKKEQGTNFAPLSFSQERFWIQEQLAPGSINSLSFTARIRGDLKVAILEQSLTEIVRRHDSLRTSIMVVNGQPMQSIAAPRPFQLPVISMEQFPPAEREAAARRASTVELSRPFDIAQGPLFRAILLRLDAQDHVLILITQHLISDAWSLSILLQELGVLYEAFSIGQFSPLPPLPFQYADFAQWQREQMQGETLERELAYWIKQVGGSASVLDIPTDRPRGGAQKTGAAREPTTIPVALREQLKALAQQESCTLFMVLLTSLQVLLHRYTGQLDISIYTLVANRTANTVEKLIGLFLNTLLMRVDLSRNLTFAELLRQVRQVTLDAYDHQTIPFQKLLEALQAQRDFTRAPLLQVLLLLQNVPYPTIKFANLTCERFVREMDFQTDMELSLSLVESDEGLIGWLEYQTDLYDVNTIRRLLAHYQTLLASAAKDPQQRISDLPLMTAPERQHILLDWNNTAADYPRERSLHELFEAQAECTPEAVAVVCEQQCLTYRDLNRRATQLAHQLRARGVGSGTPVGLCLERSVDMIVGLLGILKAGGAYVPLDPAYLAQRLDFIMDDIQLPLLLAHSDLAPQLSTITTPLLFIDRLQAGAVQDVAQLPGGMAAPDQLAYIIYTSGSTGQPKGVMIPHSALVQYTTAAVRHFHLTPLDRVLQFASISFDAAAEEIFPCLISGAALILRSDRMLDSSETFWQECTTYGVTVLDLPTAYWHALIAQWDTALPEFSTALRLIILGGESAAAEWVAAWHAHAPQRIHLVNTYGPTETTIVATQCELTRDMTRRVPIGRPIANTYAYVLDQSLQPVPVGVVGELYIGGADLARGYFNRPALTAAAFIPDPFSARPGARLYRTGDLARYWPDGNLEFQGRGDHQVKIRGFRIELGEIETALRRHPAIQQAVVVAREVDGPFSDRQLVAYLVSQTGPLDPGDLRRFLQNQLPAYMLPTAFVTLESLPLTPTGKVDRRALPPPDFSGTRDSYAPPETAVEEKLAEIWSEVLPVKRIGIRDNFFELGGHSLLATQAIYRINQAFQLDLPMRSLFEEPTLAGLGLLIEERLVEEEIANQTAGK